MRQRRTANLRSPSQAHTESPLSGVSAPSPQLALGVTSRAHPALSDSPAALRSCSRPPPCTPQRQPLHAAVSAAQSWCQARATEEGRDHSAATLTMTATAGDSALRRRNAGDAVAQHSSRGPPTHPTRANDSASTVVGEHRELVRSCVSPLSCMLLCAADFRSASAKVRPLCTLEKAAQRGRSRVIARCSVLSCSWLTPRRASRRPVAPLFSTVRRPRVVPPRPICDDSHVAPTSEPTSVWRAFASATRYERELNAVNLRDSHGSLVGSADPTRRSILARTLSLSNQP